MRNTLAFAFGLSAMAKKSTVRKKSKVVCNFEDETIRIPGCHGNSVIKFEVFDGEYVVFCVVSHGHPPFDLVTHPCVGCVFV